MALEAVQAQAGHRSLESTRVYLHLANDWLAAEYIRAAEIIEASRLDEVRGGGQVSAPASWPSPALPGRSRSSSGKT